ncbi:MAG: hypothetical protein ACO1OO_09565 [Flavisolibacter sp.]
MGFEITIFFVFEQTKIRGTNPTKLNTPKNEASALGRSETYSFFIDEEKVNHRFRSLLKNKLQNSNIRRNRKYYSYDIYNPKFHPGIIRMPKNEKTYCLVDGGIDKAIYAINRQLLAKKKRPAI